MTNDPPRNIAAELAPSGKLRAAINFGNPVLVQKDKAAGAPRGVSPDLARELAKRLGVPIEYVPYDAAGKVFDALQAGAWDVAFLAIDPARAAGIDFTSPYVVIEGGYVVPADSPLRRVEDVDRDGVRVSVARASAYELYLSRTLKHATLIREPGGDESVERFLKDRLEVLAGVKQSLAAFAQSQPGMRLIPGRFMQIEQAMGTPKGRPVGARYLRDFVEAMKASGFVAKALAASGQGEASVAPPAPR